MAKNMKIIGLLLLIWLVNIINSEVKETEPKDPSKENKEKYEKIMKGGKQLLDFGTSLSESKNVFDVVNAITDFAKALPYLGPIAEIVSGILKFFKPEKIQEDPVMKQLMALDYKMSRILNKLDDVMQQVENVAIISRYKDERKAVYVLQEHYTRYLNHSNNNTRDDLINECNKYSMISFIGYIDREILTEDLQPLSKFITQDYSEKQLFDWSKLIVANLGQAMFLHSICLELKYGHQDDVGSTLETDNFHFNETLKNIQAKFLEFGTNLRENFFKNHAINEIERLMVDNAGESYYYFVKNIYDYLLAKYPWRSWYVWAVDKPASDYKYKLYQWDVIPDSNYSHEFKAPHGKRLFVSSADGKPRAWRMVVSGYAFIFPRIIQGHWNWECPDTYNRADKYGQAFKMEEFVELFKGCLAKRGIRPEAIGVVVQHWNEYKNYFMMNGYNADKSANEMSSGGVFVAMPQRLPVYRDYLDVSRWFENFELVVIDKDLSD